METHTNQRSPRLVNLNLKTSKEECLLTKYVDIGTIDECYYGEYYPFTVPNSIQDARSAPDAALWETAIQMKLIQFFKTTHYPNQ